MLEDEGIFYYFEQSEDKHTLVLANDKSRLEPCPNKPQARYLATTGSSQPSAGKYATGASPISA